MIYNPKYIFLFILFLTATLHGQEKQMEFTEDDSKFKVRGVAELGYFAVLSHRIQFSNSGTEIDYKKDGGQENLYPFSRISLEADFGPKHSMTLLYQPLIIETKSLLDRDLIIDDLLFPANSGVNFLYNFSFYRISYLRQLASLNDKYDFGIGLTVQIRNATIDFESLDGSLYRRNANIGIVPALKLKAKINLSERVFWELEADGIYAPVSYLNGSDNEIVGAILDASMRVGYVLRPELSTFLNLRYLGGGAVGTDPDFTGPGDGFVENWLNFLSVTTGAVYAF